MQLLTTEDPRDNLQKANRWELVAFAKENGIDLDENTPAIVSAKILRDRGLTNIKIPDRPLGLYVSSKNEALVEHAPSVKGEITINAEDDLVRQYEQQQKARTDLSSMTIGQLRVACKERGIKMSRRDNMQTLREKLGQ